MATSVGTVSSYTFPSVKANHTIAASFKLQQFAIEASAGTRLRDQSIGHDHR